MKRFLISFVILGLMAGSVAAAEAEESNGGERAVEASYYGPQLLYHFRSCAPSGGAGCVTLETRANERSLTAHAVDAHGQPVSVWVVDASQDRDPRHGASAVYGTFCGKTTEPIRFDPDTTLELWIGGEWWPTWWIVPKVDCSPGLATTGTVQVTLSGGRTSSEQPAIIERSVDLTLRGRLRTLGEIVSDVSSCRSNVPVVIQRRSGSDWVDVGSATTGADGAFALRLKDRPGRYRAIAPKASSPERTCLAAVSATERHRQ